MRPFMLRQWGRESLTLLLLLATAFLLAQAVYQMPRSATFTAATPTHILPRSGFSILESFADEPGSFRWTTGTAQVQFPNPGGQALIAMKLAGGPGRTVPVQLSAAGLTQIFLVAPTPRVYTLLVPPSPGERLRLQITGPTVREPRDDRDLGVVVGDMVLAGGGAAPLRIWLTFMSVTAGAYGLLRLLWRRRSVAVVGIVSGQVLVMFLQGGWGWQYSKFTPALLVALTTGTSCGMLYLGRAYVYQGNTNSFVFAQRFRILSREAIKTRWFVYTFLISWTAIFGIRFFTLIHRYAINILFWDQWDFYTPLFNNDSLWDIFNRQHGPHRQGIGFVVATFLADLTHWNSRAESFGVGVILCGAMLLAFYIKWRLFGKFTYADITIPLIFLVTTQYEVVTGAINFSHGAFPVLLVMLYCISWLQQNPAIRYPLVALLNFLLIFTGFGIFMGAVTPFLLLVDGYHMLARREFGKAVFPCFALVAAFVSIYIFLRGYAYATSIDCFVFPHEKPWEYPWFVSLMFSGFGGFSFTAMSLVASLVGMVLFVFLMGALVYHGWRTIRTTPTTYPISLIITILVGYVLLYAGNTAVGRVCLGVAAAQASRYMTLLIPAFLGGYFCLLTFDRVQLQRGVLIGYMLVILPGMLPLRFDDHHPATYYTHWKKQWKDCYLETRDFQHCNLVVGKGIYPYASLEIQQKLDYLEEHHLNLFLDAD